MCLLPLRFQLEQSLTWHLGGSSSGDTGTAQRPRMTRAARIECRDLGGVTLGLCILNPRGGEGEECLRAPEAASLG